MTAVDSRPRGRFAPSPSGPLHFGSLIAALGSYLHAKSPNIGANGQWLLRIEDIDQPRTVAGASSAILATLEQFGLQWDETEVFQSQRLDFYQQQFQQLQQQGLIYGCQCNRARLQQLSAGYDGHCRELQLSAGQLGWRLKTLNVATEFTDAIQGKVQIDTALAQEDYLIKRRDGLFSYQLVVVLDDMAQRINQVVRGADLLTMTTRQQALLHHLAAPIPLYAHLPVAVSAPGQKLSKQNHATDIRHWPLSQSLSAALQFLGHPPPAELQGAACAELLNWALKHWQITQVPPQPEQLISTFT